MSCRAWRCTREGSMVETNTREKAMNKFRVFVKDKFDVVFDTIEKARECRKALKQLKYKGIEIIVTQEDIDPR